MTSATAPRDKNGYQASAWHFAALIAGTSNAGITQMAWAN